MSDDPLPEVAYESAKRGANGGKLHLLPDCRQLASTTPREVSLDTFPPAHRDWCSECGPDATPSHPPQEDKSQACSECGEQVALALVDDDGVCLGCRQPDDDPDARLVADGGDA